MARFMDGPYMQGESAGCHGFEFPEHYTADVEVDVEVKKDASQLEDRPPLTAFEQDLRFLINKRCMENDSNTPDFILAEYLAASLAAFNVATRQRERWYGRKVF